ncbi:MAG: hypothetical protein FWE23_05565 [Chitinivibrionia bacterium]|nr:hypothetical protein [Chitinivibrionia bacterium]
MTKHSSWLIPCKDWFLVDIAFEKVQKLEWAQNRFLLGMKEGDIVYIYKTKPYSEIKYKAIITKVKIKYSDLQFNDSEFIIKKRNYKEKDLFFEFEFCNDLPQKKITFKMLEDWGFSIPQSKKLPNTVAEKIANAFAFDLLDNDDNQIQEKINLAEPATTQQAENSSKRTLDIVGNKNSEAVQRDIKYSKYVLKEANYVCQIKSSHTTFLTNLGFQYMEGHHLIPCTVKNAKDFEKKYNVNIDCVENIVCICPTCHRAVHFGDSEVKKMLVKEMFSQHKEILKNIGIDITEDELLKLYI